MRRPAAAVAVLLAAGAAASPAHGGARPPVSYVNLTEVTVKPKRIFTAFNSSPYIDKLRWSGWGTAKATGKGIYVSKCASCPGPRLRKATVRLYGGLRTCPGGAIRVYRRASVTVNVPDHGSNRRTYRLESPCPPPPPR